MRAVCAIFVLTVLPVPVVTAQFMIVQPVVAQYDGGPSIAAGSAFGSGESIFLSFDLAGFKPEGDEDLRLKLSWDCQAFDSDGRPYAPLQKGDVRVNLAPEDKKWRPRVRVELALPQALSAGTGEIRLTAVDHVGGGKATLQVPIRTRGLNLAGVEKLTPLRFRFLRSEDAFEALNVPSYSQGDMVWGRFEIAGYKLGEDNAFGVRYGLEVQRANGESLFKQDEAANETGKSYYPRRYVTGTLSLQLTKELAKGEYTIVLRIQDDIGKQQSETRHSFRVE